MDKATTENGETLLARHNFQKNSGLGTDVMQKIKAKKDYELARGGRIKLGSYVADYNQRTQLRRMIEKAIEEIGVTIVRSREMRVIQSSRADQRLCGTNN